MTYPSEAVKSVLERTLGLVLAELLRSALASLATAGSGDTVIRVYFNGDVAEFERQYRTFISKILDEPLLTRPRGSDRPGVQDGS